MNLFKHLKKYKVLQTVLFCHDLHNATAPLHAHAQNMQEMVIKTMNFKNRLLLYLSPSEVLQSTLSSILCMYNKWLLFLTVDALSTCEKIFGTASSVMFYSGTKTAATWDPQAIKYSIKASNVMCRYLGLTIRYVVLHVLFP